MINPMFIKAQDTVSFNEVLIKKFLSLQGKKACSSNGIVSGTVYYVDINGGKVTVSIELEEQDRPTTVIVPVKECTISTSKKNN